MLASSSRGALKRACPRVTARPLLAWTRSSVSGSDDDGCTPLGRAHAQIRHASDVAQRRPPAQYSRQPRPLRNAPYAYTADPGWKAPQHSTLGRYNDEIARHVRRRNLSDALQVCAEMRQKGVKPDLVTYTNLLQGCADDQLHTEAWALIEDMDEMGIRPDRTAIHYLLHSVRDLESKEFYAALQLMEKYNIEPNVTTYQGIVSRQVSTSNLESALETLADMYSRGVMPNLAIAQNIILLACSRAHPRLALDVAETFESSSARRLECGAWVHMLIASSEALYADGVALSWKKVVREMSVTPDEGICMNVLHTAARNGLPTLAQDVLAVLQKKRVVLREFHFAPYIEALCRAKELRAAFDSLQVMRTHGVTPIAETTIPILKAISHDPDAVDEAWTTLEDLHAKNNAPVDVAAFNVIIQAAIKLGDMQRSIGTYQAAGSLGVAPNVETFNMLLSGCITARHRELGDKMLADMKEASVVPDARTYERFIVLCLTQDNYEDAFFYLEEMKEQKHLPSAAVYEAIVRKCAALGDTRATVALQEMTECGYTISNRLQAFVQSGGRDDRPEEVLEDRVQRPVAKDLEEKRRLFLTDLDSSFT